VKPKDSGLYLTLTEGVGSTQNILHALHFDLKERRFKLKQQRTKDEACIERHAVYSNVSGKPFWGAFQSVKKVVNWTL
jgi:hypothetical protein